MSTVRWRNLTIAEDVAGVGVHIAVGPWQTACCPDPGEPLPLDPTDAPVTCSECLGADVLAKAKVHP